MFRIFPATLKPDGDRIQKVPIESGWQRSATDDMEQIALWQDLYRQEPKQLKMWGIPTGADNNILVLDVDVKDPTKNGFETLRKITSDTGEKPLLESHHTPQEQAKLDNVIVPKLEYGYHKVNPKMEEKEEMPE